VVHGRRDVDAAAEVARVVARSGTQSPVVTGDLADPAQVARPADAVLDRFVMGRRAGTAGRHGQHDRPGPGAHRDGGISAQGGPWGAMRDLW
jgi:hypothetical protein